MPFLEIENFDWDNGTGQVTLYVRYLRGSVGFLDSDEVSLSEVTLSHVYMNDTWDAAAVFNPRVLADNQTSKITLSIKCETEPSQIRARVYTTNELVGHGELIVPYYETRIEDVEWDEGTGKIRVFVKNTGDKAVTFSNIYINGEMDEAAIADPRVLAVNQISEIIFSGTYMDIHTQVPINVTTLEGAFSERYLIKYGIWIQSISLEDGQIKAYLYSIGFEKERFAHEIPFSRVYINGTLDEAATIASRGIDLYSVTLSKIYADIPSQLILRVVTPSGVSDDSVYPYLSARVEIGQVTFDPAKANTLSVLLKVDSERPETIVFNSAAVKHAGSDVVVTEGYVVPNEVPAGSNMMVTVNLSDNLTLGIYKLYLNISNDIRFHSSPTFAVP